MPARITFASVRAGDGIGKMIVHGQDHRALRPHRFREHALLFRDGFPAAQVLDVRHADIGDDGRIRPGNARERRDLARVVHAQLEDAEFDPPRTRAGW